jgi:hypothetical protein
VYLNGYYNKPIIYINENFTLENTKIPIRRLLVIYGKNKRDTIYLYPSFVLKYCPFTLNDIEWVYTHCISKNIEPFTELKDPDKLLESSIPYENWAFRIIKILKDKNFQEIWAKHFYETFYTIINTEKTNDFLLNCLSMIRDFLSKLNININGPVLLSFANYQLPFR